MRPANHFTRRDLLTPDEVMRLDANWKSCRARARRPMAASKARYYADPEFPGRFEKV